MVLIAGCHAYKTIVLTILMSCESAGRWPSCRGFGGREAALEIGVDHRFLFLTPMINEGRVCLTRSNILVA